MGVWEKESQATGCCSMGGTSAMGALNAKLHVKGRRRQLGLKPINLCRLLCCPCSLSHTVRLYPNRQELQPAVAIAPTEAQLLILHVVSVFRLIQCRFQRFRSLICRLLLGPHAQSLSLDFFAEGPQRRIQCLSLLGLYCLPCCKLFPLCLDHGAQSHLRPCRPFLRYPGDVI